MRSLQVAPGLLSAGMLALILSACGLKTAPDRQALQQENLPNLKLPAAWVETSAAGPVQDNWIATLGDPQLPALVTEAITYNADLRLAVARVEEAAANVKAAGAVGHGAIYTNHVVAIQILRRIILRIGAKLDYLILKMH